MKKRVISLVICIFMIAVHIPNVFAAETVAYFKTDTQPFATRIKLSP